VARRDDFGMGAHDTTPCPSKSFAVNDTRAGGATAHSVLLSNSATADQGSSDFTDTAFTPMPGRLDREAPCNRRCTVAVPVSRPLPHRLTTAVAAAEKWRHTTLIGFASQTVPSSWRTNVARTVLARRGSSELRLRLMRI